MHADCLAFLPISAFCINSVNALTLCKALAVVYRWVFVKCFITDTLGSHPELLHYHMGMLV